MFIGQAAMVKSPSGWSTPLPKPKLNTFAAGNGICMKLRQLFSRRTRVERSSLTGILPRVQRMRQSCKWDPIVSPETIEEREQRLSQARKGIAWHPQTFDVAATTRDPKDETKRLTWLLAALVAAVILICLSVELATAQPNHYVGSAFTYRLGST